MAAPEGPGIVLDDANFVRMANAIRKIEGFRGDSVDSSGMSGDHLIFVRVTNTVPIDGWHNAVFVTKRSDTGAWTDGDGCLVRGVRDEVLVTAVYAGVVFDTSSSGFPLVLAIVSGGGDRIEVGEPFNSGVAPPHAKLLDWRIMYLDLADFEFDAGESAWVVNANA